MTDQEYGELPRKDVESSNIASVGYHSPTSTLVLEFIGNAFYKYSPVTADGHQALLKAESVGKFFYKNIKSNSLIECTPLDYSVNT